MGDATYDPKTYKKDGGDTHVIASGGKIDVESGGIVDTSAATGGLLVAAGEIDTADLATDAVETAKINALAVTTAKIAANAVTPAELATDAVETAKINALAVTAAKLAASAVETAKINALAVTEAKLAANAVTTGKVETDLLQYVDKQLTNAEMLAVRATPIDVVAAPGANRAIIVHKILIVSDSVGAAYTESTDNLALEYSGGQDILTIETTGLIDSGDVQIRTMGAPEAVLTPSVNESVRLFNSGDGEFGAGNAANTFSIRVWYSVADTVAFS